MSDDYMIGHPDPDQRKRIVDAALKGTGLETAYIKATTPKTAEEQVLQWLGITEATINAQCASIIKAETIKDGDWNRQAAGHMLASLWKEHLASKSRDDLHLIACVVLSRIGMEWLEQVDTTPPELL